MSRNNVPSVSLGHVLVTGGCGFLGNTIVQLLLERKVCSTISALDLRPAKEPKAGVDYHFGDLTDEAGMQELFQKIKPTVVIHTASPLFDAKMPELMYKVNVNGTKSLVKVSQETGVKAFVYTSSASVISDNATDLINADEEYPMVLGDQQTDYYTTTKGQAEQHVLASNRPAAYPDFLTCAIRPSGIFGAGDVQLLPHMIAVHYSGQTSFQLGDNSNLFDFTEVTNVAHAHHLAAAALLTTLSRAGSGAAAPLDTEKVDGEVFIITNDSPVYFWDFARMVWTAAGAKLKPTSKNWVISKDLGLFIATAIEWIFWLVNAVAKQGLKPKLSRQQVRYSCMTRYFCIDKAKRRLGYKPVVGLKEGVERGVADIASRNAVPGFPRGFPPPVEGASEEEKKEE